MNKNILELGRRLLMSYDDLTSPYNHRTRMVSFLLEGRRHKNTGFNLIKTHPLMQHFSPYPFMHAEANVLIKEGIANCSGLNLCVLRMRRSDDTLTMAKPCKYCLDMIDKAGINKVYFSNWNGDIEQWK